MPRAELVAALGGFDKVGDLALVRAHELLHVVAHGDWHFNDLAVLAIGREMAVTELNCLCERALSRVSDDWCRSA